MHPKPLFPSFHDTILVYTPTYTYILIYLLHILMARWCASSRLHFLVLIFFSTLGYIKDTSPGGFACGYVTDPPLIFSRYSADHLPLNLRCNPIEIFSGLQGQMQGRGAQGVERVQDRLCDTTVTANLRLFHRFRNFMRSNFLECYSATVLQY
ncbi:uncharacterized protein F4822DRAFT_61769 [Hypoxylon trugodes]|uniref:uncharacterized protein n=1 Tax=Hypoxylon trugodes TaxID=326681 RepID=UPI00218D8D49|nr:uncharacterized protein F4822DRAFT_61769 [Hypoxylon trugodes]KAI1384121.1 hypothetical protein F4822DRAFT_61769 [Hypoxylon trugodes]